MEPNTLDHPRAQLGDKFAKVKQDVGELAGAAAHTAREQFDHLRECSLDRAAAAKRQVVDTVRNRPGTSLLVAIGVGFLAYHLFARRH